MGVLGETRASVVRSRGVSPTMGQVRVNGRWQWNGVLGVSKVLGGHLEGLDVGREENMSVYLDAGSDRNDKHKIELISERVRRVSLLL